MESKEQEILSLCDEIIADIELSRCGLEQALLKGSRIARLLDDTETWQWLQMELRGYPAEATPLSQKYARLTNRKSPWWDQVLDESQREKWYPYPAAHLSAGLETARTEIASSAGKTFSGQYAVLTQAKHYARLKGFHEAVARLEQVRSGILSLLYDYVTRVLYTKRFSGVSQSIFDRYREEVDVCIVATNPDIPEMLDSAYGRLSEGDSEAKSQALSTCRRIIRSFADSVYPPREDPVLIGNKSLDCGPDKEKNRLLAFIYEKTESSDRRKRLKQTLFNLHSRLSAGVHADVKQDEAEALVLNTYLLLGELSLLM